VGSPTAFQLISFGDTCMSVGTKSTNSLIGGDVVYYPSTGTMLDKVVGGFVGDVVDR
jgi:hypothetical protein